MSKTTPLKVPWHENVTLWAFLTLIWVPLDCLWSPVARNDVRFKTSSRYLTLALKKGKRKSADLGSGPLCRHKGPGYLPFLCFACPENLAHQWDELRPCEFNSLKRAAGLRRQTIPFSSMLRFSLYVRSRFSLYVRSRFSLYFRSRFSLYFRSRFSLYFRSRFSLYFRLRFSLYFRLKWKNQRRLRTQRSRLILIISSGGARGFWPW